MKDEDKKLDDLLAGWVCPLSPDDRLGAQVWRRIAAREEERGWATSWWEAFRTRPAFAGVAAVVLIGGAAVTGVTAAELRVKAMRDYAQNPSLEQVYFESINPVAMARSEHRHP